MEPQYSFANGEELILYLQNFFLSLDFVGQIIMIAAIALFVVLIGTLVYYIIKGTVLLVYYILKGVVLLIVGIFKLLYKIAAKVIEIIGDTLDNIFNHDITPEKVGAKLVAAPVSPVKVEPVAATYIEHKSEIKFCTLCGNPFATELTSYIHEHGYGFCQNCGTKAEIIQ